MSISKGEERSNNVELPELNALLELRELVASELDEVAGNDQTYRSFRPLTDGLGIQINMAGYAAPQIGNSKQNSELFEKIEKSEGPIPLAVSKSYFQQEEDKKTLRPLADLIESAKVPVFIDSEPEVYSKQIAISSSPPPIPSVSLIRRLLAAILDQVFVLSLFLLALGLTLRLLAGGGFNWTFASIKAFQNSRFIQFAVLEYFTVWFCYLALCIGVLEMTFGMWVWGLRIKYSAQGGVHKFFSKAVRTLLSAIFYAPIIPIVLLVLRRKGRNMVDWLSGTSLYRTV